MGFLKSAVYLEVTRSQTDIILKILEQLKSFGRIDRQFANCSNCQERVSARFTVCEKNVNLFLLVIAQTPPFFSSL